MASTAPVVDPINTLRILPQLPVTTFNLKGGYVPTPKIWINFICNDIAIVPGQAMSFLIRFTPTRKLDLGNSLVWYLYEVNDDGNPLYAEDSSWLWKEDVTSQLSALKPNEALTVSLGPQFPQASQNTNIYKVGWHNLGVFLRDEKCHDLVGGPYMSNSDSLKVVFETVDDTWWQWVNFPIGVYPWKSQGYQITVRFINQCGAASPSKLATVLTGNIKLLETNILHKGQQSEQPETNFPFAMKAPGSAVDALFDIKPKTWEWHMPGTYILNGDLFRKYGYESVLDMNDQYGNVYPARVLGVDGIRVCVSQQKIAADAIAEAAFTCWVTFSALAVAASACIPCAAVLSAIASGFATALGIAGKIADDRAMARSW